MLARRPEGCASLVDVGKSVWRQIFTSDAIWRTKKIECSSDDDDDNAICVALVQRIRDVGRRRGGVGEQGERMLT